LEVAHLYNMRLNPSNHIYDSEGEVKVDDREHQSVLVFAASCQNLRILFLSGENYLIDNEVVTTLARNSPLLE
ncbi:hypothetical protein EV182_006150, partial [Spiromyces aspiralis]